MVEKKEADLNIMKTDVITVWLRDYFSQFDVEVFIDRYTPHEFSYGVFNRRRNSFVEQGYQLLLTDLDYMGIAQGIDPGDHVSTQGKIQRIDEAYLRFTNDAKMNGYLLTTGHQLTKRAAELAAMNRYAVKDFNQSLMADSSDVYRHIDGLFFIQLVNNSSGRKFMMMQNTKNRGNPDTPEAHKFFAYAFTTAGITDDVGGKPCWVTDIDAYGIEEGAQDSEILEYAVF
jgi:hypothetical protein